MDRTWCEFAAEMAGLSGAAARRRRRAASQLSAGLGASAGGGARAPGDVAWRWRAGDAVERSNGNALPVVVVLVHAAGLCKECLVRRPLQQHKDVSNQVYVPH